MRALMFLVSGIFFMENLDGTVIATALPSMAASFGVAPVDLNIGISAYLLALGVFIPISGWVADRLGARTVLASAIGVFTLASVLCGLSQGLGVFVVTRVLQGMGGAMMVPVGRLVVLRATPKDRLISILTTLTWPGLIAPVLGPPVGGFITTYASWRWIFYMNLPLGLLALAVALSIVPDTRSGGARPFDGRGFLLTGLAVLALMYGVELVSRADSGWQAVAVLLASGAVLLLLALRHLRRAAAPMLDLAVLRVPTFAVAVRGGSLFRAAISAVPFLLPLMFQVGFGMDAFRSGLLVLAVFAGNLLMKTVTTPILRRFGFRPTLLCNGVLIVVSLLACALLSAGTPVVVTVAVLFFGGLTRSMQFTTLSTLAFADIQQPSMSAANTLFSTITQLTMGVGIALGAIAIRLGRLWADAAGWQAVPAVDFKLAFVLVSLVALAALFDAAGLERSAGSNLR